MKSLLLFLIATSVMANPNTRNYKVKFGAKYFQSSKLLVDHKIGLVLESNSMEERCFFKMEEIKKVRGKNKQWDCLYRSQKEVPNLAFKDLLGIFKDSYVTVAGKELPDLTPFISETSSLFFNGKKTKQTFLELKPGKYEISFRETQKTDLNLVKISLEIY